MMFLHFLDAGSRRTAIIWDRIASREFCDVVVENTGRLHTTIFVLVWKVGDNLLGIFPFLMDITIDERRSCIL
ncbi:hypothetical protein C491_14722 [Natronococcus amylolyticus DSM 10524]|uniref:Uncharacterized protein n=1 Tax=Natronococcus amylolyticus DSM 10524 TaxID=1227497 RepID=L9X3A9_9EURY|nr:hypothetical protein C491_14722 [Natronococcus amylolyticus DSM 10524]